MMFVVVCFCIVFFFFKQKTAYEMRISDWSSDVCSSDLSATTDQIALVVTFNIIATAIATPMTGWLAARFSRRAILIWGVIGFTCASLACGLATSLEGLVLFRVLQGAFGAPLVPLSQAIVMDSYPRERQADRKSTRLNSSP